METTIVGLYRDVLYWSYSRITEKTMEATIEYCGYMGDNGKENGNYYNGFV